MDSTSETLIDARPRGPEDAPDISFTPVQDRRTGDRMEIVIPVFNEAARIGILLEALCPRYDVVLLDGGSDDTTIEIGMSLGASVFRRDPVDTFGEGYFVAYVNRYAKSGRCLYLFADEFIAESDLTRAERHLGEPGAVVLGRRIDWFYGHRLHKDGGIGCRGLRRGDARLDLANQHDSLKYPKPAHTIVVDIHHVHAWTMRKYFGTIGEYSARDVDSFLAQPNAAYLIMRRFFLKEIGKTPFELWKLRGGGWSRLAISVLVRMVVCLSGFILWLERKRLPSVAEQISIMGELYAADRLAGLEPGAGRRPDPAEGVRRP